MDNIASSYEQEKIVSWQLAADRGQPRSMGHVVRGQRGRRTDDRWFTAMNIEPQNKKPQNDEVITSIFEIPCSTFCGSKRR